ncbi:MAG: hypothetical protein LCH92_08060 [Proteobacteria bacterium]|nr:hypothetical protein [Pseudomonadota bacterium]
MTLSEYRAWLDGFLAATGGAMTAEQAEAMRAKLATVQEATPIDWSKIGPGILPRHHPDPVWPEPYVTCGDPPGSITQALP